MMDWLSSKVALSVAAVMLLASVGGAFELVKARNSREALEDCAAAFAGILWQLNTSALGASAVVERGDSAYPHDVLGDPLEIQVWNGLVVAKAGGRSESATAPRIAGIRDSDFGPWGSESFSFEKSGEGLVVAA